MKVEDVMNDIKRIDLVTDVIQNYKNGKVDISAVRDAIDKYSPELLLWNYKHILKNLEVKELKEM